MSTFGPNSAYINELYFEYLKNPNAFDARWREFFSHYDPNAPDDGAVVDTGLSTVPNSNGSHDAGDRVDVRGGNGSNDFGNRAGKPQRTDVIPTKDSTPSPQPQQRDPDENAPVSVPDNARQLAGVASRIVQNMEASLAIPTATSFREIPVKLLEENRTLINGYLKASDQGKLSFTHIIGWALVKALRSYPSLNNGYQEFNDKPYVLERKNVNLGLAIDLERPGGGRSLVVPSIKNANELDFRSFFDTYEDLVRKARQAKLSPDDFSGTTITLTNPGTIGTVASVPRLMAGQGTIIATGGINYPAAYQAMDAETLSELGISKVMQMTSTYDHRIIQGAESGMFLAMVQDLLMGADDFYEEIFRDLRIPYRPLAWERDRHPAILTGDRSTQIEKQQRILRMINNFRVRGHLLAHLNPLGYEPGYHSDLDPATYGLTIWDFDRKFWTGGLAGMDRADLRTILAIVRDTYTQRIGVEYMHIQDPEQRLWLQDRMEISRNSPELTKDEKRRILRKLSEAEGFERFLQTKYPGSKRFSLEGAETTIAMLDELVHRAADTDVRELLIGMPHRGRLNILATVIGKNPGKIFSEFEDNADPDAVLGSGDVKYHLGQKGTVVTEKGGRILVRMAPNPSHLEAVNPVIEGMARALQDKHGEHGADRFIPLLVHGDAAFMGQGVVAETLNMSQLEGYHTGGTIHLVINNQIGFTAAPRDTRSTLYATDIAKMVGAPIFHVNGDDPESSIHVMRLAFDYRQRFKRDVVVDMICYRRFGHNEGDEPSYTNPQLYAKIRHHESVRRVYTDRLVRNGTLTMEQATREEEDFKNHLETLLAATKAQPKPALPGDPLADQRINPEETWSNPQTGAPEFMIQHVIATTTEFPASVHAHPKLVAQFQKRRDVVSTVGVDWALAEALAFGTLLLEGTSVRLSGQDSERGTFSQRHSVIHNQVDDGKYIPLNHLSDTQPHFHVFDSPLSEYAVLGFEYGYSVANPDMLVMWEGQFGDFVNGAQIIIDQFVSSGEDKWGQTSSVVLLLPHGFEGQGPEHSSARIERFLTLSAEDNMRIAYPTTAAQYFHLLRRQAKQDVKKPMIILTPKSLLRDPLVHSPLADFTQGEFQKVIGEIDRIDPVNVRRLIFCTGKIYYDLIKARRATEQKDVAIVRVEKLYPFPDEDVRAELVRYATVQDIVWVQEEPKNMGAWPTLSHWISAELGGGQQLRFLGRPASGSPASGSARSHAAEQAEIVRRALVVNVADSANDAR